jgi:hypothetical protein
MEDKMSKRILKVLITLALVILVIIVILTAVSCGKSTTPVTATPTTTSMPTSTSATSSTTSTTSNTPISTTTTSSTPTFTSTSTPTTTSTQTTVPVTGNTFFFVRDAAGDLDTVTSVTITVDSLLVHSRAGAWTTVSTTPMTYDLLQLKATGKNQLLVQADLPPGTYDKLELNISSVVVTDAKGAHQAILPSGKIQITTTLEVTANAIATAGFDFFVAESVHLTGKGIYILAPSIRVDTRNEVQVQVTASNEVQVTGGKVVASIEVGMDINGNVGAGMGILPNLVLDIVNGKIVVVPGHAAVNGTLKSINAVAGTITVTPISGADLVLKVNSTTQLDGSTGPVIEILAANIGALLRVEYNVSTQTATMIIVR